jgi:hypothetical protein
MSQETLDQTADSDQTTTPDTDSVQGIMDRTFPLVVEFGRFGNRRKASMQAVTVNAEKELLSLSKKLLNSEPYDDIASHDRDIKVWLEGIAVPYPPLRGVYLIPIPSVDAVKAQMDTFKAEREALVATFKSTYDATVESMAAELRELYCATDYPSAEEVAEKFTMSFQFRDFDVPGRLKAVNRAVYDSERAKIHAEFKDATVEIRNVMRAHVAELVDHLVDRLTPGPDGRKKKFRATSVTALQDFLTTFELRNVTGDMQLSQIVAQAKSLLSGVDVTQLRKEDGLRDALATGFTQIRMAMDGMVVKAPARLIAIGDVAVDVATGEIADDADAEREAIEIEAGQL